MAILSLALYGSRARGDFNNSSDIDLFAVTNEDHYKMIVDGSSNLACYPEKLALQRADSGDLFILHICEEAKEIYCDGFGIESIRSAFRYKDDYMHEKLCAADLAWFLMDFSSSFRNVFLLNKRMAWCVRTILIASSAEVRNPIFSREDLASFSGEEKVGKFIMLKDSSNLDLLIFKDIEDFLINFGFQRPKLNDLSRNAYWKRFKQNKNAMGIKTFMAMANDEAPFSYS